MTMAVTQTRILYIRWVDLRSRLITNMRKQLISRYSIPTLSTTLLLLLQYLLNMSKILTVFRATGNQGGSVIETVLFESILSKEFKIMGITRDDSKPAAQALAAKGVEAVTVSLVF